MTNRYEAQGYDASGKLFLATIEREYCALPEINTLDEYAHLKQQLVEMRSRGGDYHPGTFGMEFALLMRLNEYCRMIGVPDLSMPGEDGQGLTNLTASHQ
ncbi:MAG: hypothetical protein AAFY35_16515 [Pseudomonadota bacterium]